jgi:hypothetical protein
LRNSAGNPPPNDCAGFYCCDFNARIQDGVDPALAAGASVCVQYWFRDPESTTNWTTGRSNALYFLLGP